MAPAALDLSCQPRAGQAAQEMLQPLASQRLLAAAVLDSGQMATLTLRVGEQLRPLFSAHRAVMPELEALLILAAEQKLRLALLEPPR